MATKTKTRAAEKLRWRVCPVDPRHDWRKSWVSRGGRYRITLSRIPGLPAYWEAAEWRPEPKPGFWAVLSKYFMRRGRARLAAIEACEARARGGRV